MILALIGLALIVASLFIYMKGKTVKGRNKEADLVLAIGLILFLIAVIVNIKPGYDYP